MRIDVKIDNMIQNCLQCKKEFKAKPSHIAKGNSKWCSRVCFGLSTRGRVMSKEWREKLGLAHKGKRKTAEANKKNSDAHKGEKSPLWKGGVSAKNLTLRQNIMSTTEYRKWRRDIFDRDNFTCLECGARNGNGKNVKLNADHIEAFSTIMQKHNIDCVQQALICAELWSISNGRTLCVDCHKKTPTWGSRPLSTNNLNK